MKRQSLPPLAFSLIEVVLALGIFTFAIVSVFSLLPNGLQSSRDSVEESAVVNVLCAVIADRKATASSTTSTIYQLPALTPKMEGTTCTLGIADGNQQAVTLSLARYRITCTFTPPAAGTLGPYTGYFKASWPAQKENSPNYVETIVTFPQQ
ncbi:MAG: hypothetical protein ACFUZC_11960 [Chthoniobacteraceae bacterium]